MGVDYTGYLGLGRQTSICNNRFPFPYAKFNELEESGFLNDCGFEVLLTSQEYKGTICGCTLFVGKLLHSQDLRDTRALPVTATVAKINAADFSDEEKSKLDRICESLKLKLELDDEFGEYGMSLLVRCW